MYQLGFSQPAAPQFHGQGHPNTTPYGNFERNGSYPPYSSPQTRAHDINSALMVPPTSGHHQHGSAPWNQERGSFEQIGPHGFNPALMVPPTIGHHQPITAPWNQERSSFDSSRHSRPVGAQTFYSPADIPQESDYPVDRVPGAIPFFPPNSDHSTLPHSLSIGHGGFNGAAYHSQGLDHRTSSPPAIHHPSSGYKPFRSSEEVRRPAEGFGQNKGSAVRSGGVSAVRSEGVNGAEGVAAGEQSPVDTAAGHGATGGRKSPVDTAAGQGATGGT